MNDIEKGCAGARELLPDYAAGRLEAADVARVDLHLATCDQCREELELVGMLVATRVAPPVGLDDRVVSALGRRRTVAHRPWWGLSAAAVAAVALGIGISSGPTRTSDPLQVEPIATEFEEGDFWVSDDGLLAGAPALEELSDEALEQLLQELAAETPGGAA
jgi:anti-sigma factor RsiW